MPSVLCYLHAAMDLKQLSKFSIIFYIFGQCQYDPLHLKRSLSTRLVSLMYFFASLLLSTYAVDFLLNALRENSRNKTEATVSLLIIWPEILAISIITYKTLRHGNLFDLWTKLHQLEQSFQLDFGARMCFRKFVKRIILRGGTCIGAFLLFMICRFLVYRPVEILQLKLASTFLFILTLVGKLHAIFYAELLAHYKNHLTKAIDLVRKTETLNSRKYRYYDAFQVRKVHQTLLNIQRVLFDLKHISNIISHHFGWGVIVICFFHGFNITYTLFWIVTHSSKGKLRMLGKHLFTMH